jgi:AraC-like DNA-binding protein
MRASVVSAWLGRAQDAPLLAEVERLSAKARTLPAEVRQLAALLEGDPRATLAGAASSLAISKSTLQRMLAEHGTSFRSELDPARVRTAQRLLHESSERIARVAFDVGLLVAPAAERAPSPSGRRVAARVARPGAHSALRFASRRARHHRGREGAAMATLE